MARVLLVHNPDAGFNQPGGDEILEMIRRAGHQPIYQSSKLADLGPALAQGVDLVAAAGGDGTVTTVLRWCAGLGAPVAILPMGTANNVAVSLGQRGKIEELIRRWGPGDSWRARARAYRLGLARGAWGVSRFVESFGVGALAQSIAHRSKETDHPDFPSARARLLESVKVLRDTIGTLPSQRITVKIDGEVIAGDAVWAEVSRVGLVGPAVRIGDDADPWEPRLDIAVLPAGERGRFLAYLDGGFTSGGRHGGRSGLVTRRAERAVLSWRAYRSHMDGRELPEPADKPDRTHGVSLGLDAGSVSILTLEEARR